MDGTPPQIGRSREELAGELADLLCHALVLCAERGLPPAEVIETLKACHRATNAAAPERHRATNAAAPERHRA